MAFPAARVTPAMASRVASAFMLAVVMVVAMSAGANAQTASLTQTLNTLLKVSSLRSNSHFMTKSCPRL